MTPQLHNRYFICVAAAALCVLASAWAIPLLAVQTTPLLPPAPPPPQRMVLIPPPAAIQFQQSMQQQQIRDQLQQRQLESDLHRSVTEQAARPLDPASRNRPQLNHAEHAQMARDQAVQQSLLNQYWGVGAAQPSSRMQPGRARSGH